MTDREMLELAAKAVGMTDWTWDEELQCMSRPTEDDLLGVFVETWNPRDDSGDSMRLSVDLELNVFHAAGCAYAMSSEDDGSNEHRVSYADAGDKHQATRLAILLAAAEIGRAMP